VEDVHDKVSEVEEDPTSLRTSFAAKRLRTMLDQPVFDLTGDSDDVSLIASGGEEKDVGQRERSGNIERHEVLRLLGVCRGGSNL